MSKKNLRFRPVLAATFVSLMSLGVMSGCESLGDPLGSLCCSDFDVGADLSGVDFEADATFSAFMQATGDFAAVASAVVTDVAGACKAIAVDLGAEDDAVQETEPDALVKAWCSLAASSIDAGLAAGGSITLNIQEPSCSFSASAQASCEGGCTADVSYEAELGDVSARCDPAELSGKCEGGCSGSCEGSANLAVACDGTCEGTCEGTCTGNGSTMMGSGSCDGVCEGECRGSCTMDAGAMVTCNGECKGGCDVEIKAPKCKAELTPPSAECSGDVDCNASCEASASAKAECKPPAIEIVATGNVDVNLIGTLKLNLPKIFLAAEARLGALAANGEAVLNVGVSLDPGSLSVKAAACLVPAVSAIGQAVLNIKGSVSATASITGKF